MSVAAFPSTLLALAVSKETSFGVGVAPTLSLPVTPPSIADVVAYARDSSWRVAPAASFGHVVASQASAVSVGGPVLCDGIGVLLAGLLGDVAFAGGSPNVWTMALLNTGSQQPPTWQVVLADPVAQLAYNGVVWSSLDLSFDPSALLTWAAQGVGLLGAASAWTMPARTAEVPVAGWRAAATVGGVAEGRLLSADVQLTRQVDQKFNVDNSLGPYSARAGALSVAGTLEVVAASDAYRLAAANGTATSLDLSFTNGLTGAALRGLQVHCSSVFLTGAPRSFGSRWVEYSLAFEADANATDAGVSGGVSPVKVTLRNAVASGIYA